MLSNKLNLPPQVVRALSKDPYQKVGDISVTGLWRPPQQRHLLEVHASEVEEDVADRVFQLYGRVVHKILEEAADEDTDILSEQRFLTSFEGYQISGSPDALALTEGLLSDWKDTKVWSVVLESSAELWALQLNTYRWILQRPHFFVLPDKSLEAAPVRKVERLQVVAFMRDWSKMTAMRDPRMPLEPVKVIDIPILEDIEERIRARLSEYRLEAIKGPRPCTPEETWERPAAIAVMKAGRTKALKLFETRGEADAWMAAKCEGEDVWTVARPGVRTRCEHYCGAAPFCPQFKEYKDAKPIQNEDPLL